MKNFYKYGALLLLASFNLQANSFEKNTANTKNIASTYDFSGVYSCKGNDVHYGKFSGKITLTKKAAHSNQRNTSYDFKLEVPGYGIYPGHAAAQGLNVAMHYAYNDGKSSIYGTDSHHFGTGISQFNRSKEGKWRFEKFYYEPEMNGANTGTETCVQD
jgi:hypothetical protein